MELIFEKAKNGDSTVLLNKQFLHSSYNPTKEAKRFVDNITLNYNPLLFIIIEPCLSYIIPFLKIKFPNSKIAVVRIIKEFNKYNNDIDYVINYFEHQNDFKEYISSLFNEQLLLSSFFIQWPPILNLLQDDVNKISNDFKDIFQQAKTILITREYFEPKWFINSINFIKYINHPITLNDKIKLPVVITASGPSLQQAINTLKTKRNKFFLIALSSSISPLLSNKIIPDLIFTTDGGYWAGQHLKPLIKYNIPIAVPLEGYIPKTLLQKNTILPLSYNDGISTDLLRTIHLQTTIAERNGTVSGTAMKFATDYSNSDIFLCGLDLCSNKGFQHCQPNQLELNNKLKDNKLYSQVKRNYNSEISTGSLSIYLDWFKNYKTKDRKIYRVIELNEKQNELGQIKDITSVDFNLMLEKYNKQEKVNFVEQKIEYSSNELANFINSNINTDYWNNNLFPLSYTSLLHSPTNEEIIKKIINKKTLLLNKIEKILNG